MPYVKVADYHRLLLAEDVCFTVILGMELGFLPIEDQELRNYLATPMQAWADAAVATGVMTGGEDGDDDEIG